MAMNYEARFYCKTSAFRVLSAMTSESSVPCEDPFAEILAGPKGQTLSDSFGAGSAHFGLPDWPEFHKTWTAVRTRFIDDQIVRVAENRECKIEQLVNLGAGSLRLSFRFLSCMLVVS